MLEEAISFAQSCSSLYADILYPIPPIMLGLNHWPVIRGEQATDIVLERVPLSRIPQGAEGVLPKVVVFDLAVAIRKDFSTFARFGNALFIKVSNYRSFIAP